VNGRDRALDELIGSCPSFLAADDLHTFQALFEDGGDPDFFLRVAAFSQHLVDLVAAGRTEDVAAVAAAVERVLAQGDRQGVELIEMGLIEHTQNIVSHHDVAVTSEQVLALLGPRAREVWAHVEATWAEAAAAPAQTTTTEADYDKVTEPNLRLYFRAHTRALPDGRLLSSSDVYRQERRRLDRLRSRQRAAVRLMLAGLLLALVVLTVLVVLGS